MNRAERRALIGEKAVARAKEIAAQAPPIRPGSEQHAALSVLLARRPKGAQTEDRLR